MPTALQSVDQAQAAFYRAFSEADLEAMAAVWADDRPVACVHPSGPRHEGLPAVLASWKRIFSGASGTSIRVLERERSASSNLAVSWVVEEIGVDNPGVNRAEVLATNVYARTPNGWRMVLHHASMAPGPSPTPRTPTHH